VGETVETRLGPVDVATAGSGEPVLFVHGTPGGSDSSLVMGRFLVDAGFQVIAPSRPGYLGTPLDGRTAVDDQADLHDALLEALGHDRAGVVCWSGGGPSSYRLAVRHPDRVSSLVAFAAVSGRWEPANEGLEERLMMKTGFGNWLLREMAAHMPKSTVSATLKAEGDLTKEELKALVEEAMAVEAERDVVLTMANVVGDYAHRKAGMENDVAQFAAIESLQLEEVKAPTLVVVGSADADVSPAHSDHAAATIPGAEKVVMDRGMHLCLFVHPDAALVQSRVVAHLRG
jgi:pimeloyl-ACP methyl ester carboxylesterase